MAGSADIVYAVSSGGERLSLDMAVVVRGPATWRDLSPTDSRPAVWRRGSRTRALSGGTIGPLWVTYEGGSETLWLGEDSVAVGVANVALVEVDSAGRVGVVGTARVEPRLLWTESLCPTTLTREDEREVFRAALLSTLRADASVQAFLDR